MEILGMPLVFQDHPVLISAIVILVAGTLWFLRWRQPEPQSYDTHLPVPVPDNDKLRALEDAIHALADSSKELCATVRQIITTKETLGESVNYTVTYTVPDTPACRKSTKRKHRKHKK